MTVSEAKRKAKGRVKLEINEDELRKVIADVEAANDFTKLGDLWEAVAQTDWAKNMKPRPLSAAVVYQRVQEFGIETSLVGGTKGRVKLEVDEAELRKVIADVEAANDFTKLGELWEAVAQTDWAKNMKPRPLSAAVIYQRVQEFGIQTSIAGGTKGRVKLDIDEAELRKVIADVESKRTFTKLGDLWEAVAQTDWAKDMKPRPLSAATIYLRVQEFGIETQTKPARLRKIRTNTLEISGEIEISEDKPVVVHVPVNDSMNTYNSGVPLRSGFTMTVIPAGSCPHKLTGTDEETVTEWAKKVVKTYQGQRQTIAPSALSYFARQFYDVFSEDYKTIHENIAACKFDIYTEE